MCDRSIPAALLVLLSVLAVGCSSLEDSPEDRNPEFYNHNAQRLFDGGHYDQALNQFEKALTLDPNDETALLGRSWSRLLYGEALTMGKNKDGPRLVQQALAEFQELEHRGLGDNQYKVTLGLGKSHAILGDLYRQRVQLLTADAERNADSDPKDQAIAKARANMASEYNQSEALFHEVLSQKQNEGAKDNLTALIELAWIAVNRENYPDALLYAERYLEQVRRSKELWMSSIEKFPRDKAIWELKLASAVRKEVACRDLIASALVQLGRYEQAEDELRHIITLDPEFGDAYLRRGIVRNQLGRKKEALEDLKSFMVRAADLDLKPEDPRVMEAVRLMKRIEDELGIAPAPAPKATVGEKKTEKS